MFQVTTLDPAKPPKTPQGKVDYTQDFFARPTYLTVSGQLDGEIYRECALGCLYLWPNLPRRKFQYLPPFG